MLPVLLEHLTISFGLRRRVHFHRPDSRNPGQSRSCSGAALLRPSWHPTKTYNDVSLTPTGRDPRNA